VCFTVIDAGFVAPFESLLAQQFVVLPSTEDEYGGCPELGGAHQ
jgi:hypothetical protein